MGYIGKKPSDVPLTSSDINDNIITSAKIVNGAITGDDINSTFDISSKTVTIPSSSVTAHVTATDLQPIKSDISALALREATNESSAAFNLPNQFIDTFATDTLATKTNVVVDASGYLDTKSQTGFAPSVSAITSSGGVNNSPTFTINNTNGLITHDHTSTTRDYDNDDIYGCRIDLGSTKTITSDLYFQVTDVYVDSSNGNMGLTELNASTSAGSGYLFGGGGITPTIYTNANGGSWSDLVDGNSYQALYDQALTYNGKYFDGGSHLNAIIRYRWTENSGTISARYIDVAFANTWGRPKTFHIIHNSTSGDVNPSGTSLGIGTNTFTTQATGTAIQNTNTVGSAKTKVGGTMLYKDNAGTATLGTDLKIYFTCNGGSNWTEASSYSAITPVYSTGIKQVRLGETTCTSGTDIRYKAVWANQAGSSKETQLHGIGVNY